MKYFRSLCLLVAVLIGCSGCMTLNVKADNESRVLVIQNKPVKVETARDASIPIGVLP
jgi:uncharacterized protein YxeA